MGQITFRIDPKLEEAFRKQAGILYGARKDSVGIALRDAIQAFILDRSNDIEPPKKEV